MKSHTSNDFQLANNSKMQEEYQRLIRLPSPSDEELDRINFILEQAQTNPKLNKLLYLEDEKLARELNLFNDLESFNFDEELEPNKVKVVELFPGSTQVAKRKWRFRGDDIKHVASFLVGGILIFAISTFLKNKQPSDTQLQMSEHHSSAISPSLLTVENKAETKASVCNLDLSSVSERMKEYYISYSELDKQVTSQQLRPLEIKRQVKQLQKTAEIRQRQAEEAQRFAEFQKHQAELNEQFDEVQKWQDKASDSLGQSKQWLCLSKSALRLY